MNYLNLSSLGISDSLFNEITEKIISKITFCEESIINLAYNFLTYDSMHNIKLWLTLKNVKYINIYANYDLNTSKIGFYKLSIYLGPDLMKSIIFLPNYIETEEDYILKNNEYIPLNWYKNHNEYLKLNKT